MDHFRRNLPIRATHLKDPIIFLGNMSAPAYKASMGSYYNPIYKCFASQPNINRKDVHLVANAVSVQHGIEERSIDATKRIKEIMKNYKGKRAHLVAYSFAGIDARFALSCLNLSDCVQTLTTLSSPHTGFRLIEQVYKGQDHDISVIDRPL